MIQTLCVFPGKVEVFFFPPRVKKFASPIRRAKIILKPAFTLVNKLFSNSFQAPIYV